MKTIYMLLFMWRTLFTGAGEVQKTETVTATYLGTEAGVFYFQTAEKKLSFQAVEKGAATTVNLRNKRNKGKTFTITYTTQEIKDEAGDLINLVSIRNIILVKD